jgi:hypothetical protein
MQEILSRCGYRCDLCPAYHKNIEPDTDRQAISDGWFRYFGFRIPPEQIACPGCMGKERPLDHECPVRPCVIEKSLDSCARCPAFGCDKLKSRMESVESVVSKYGNIPKEDYDRFFLPYLSRERLLGIGKTDD